MTRTAVASAVWWGASWYYQEDYSGVLYGAELLRQRLQKSTPT